MYRDGDNVQDKSISERHWKSVSRRIKVSNEAEAEAVRAGGLGWSLVVG